MNDVYHLFIKFYAYMWFYQVCIRSQMKTHQDGKTEEPSEGGHVRF